ncbi:MAG: ATPase domain-containing protein [Desulfobacter sp.]
MNKKRVALKKVPMHVKGLDLVLNGGIPIEKTTVIKGGAGCGKSVLAMEFAHRKVLEKAPCIVVNFEESKTEIQNNYLTLGWDFKKAEQDGLLFLLCPEMKPVVMAGGAFDPQAFKSIIEDRAKKMGAKYLVMDAMDILLVLFADIRRQREILCDIEQWVRENKFTCIITAKIWHNSQDHIFDPEILDYMVSCLIELDQRVVDQNLIRSLTVRKYRGSSYKSNEHPFVITDKGIGLVPVSGTEFRTGALGKHESVGVSEFDTALGGGIREKACTIIAGPTGSGKSTLAALYAKQRTDEKKKVIYFSFDQSEGETTNNMAAVGIDLKTPIQDGRLLIRAAMIESRDTEQHLVDAVHAIEAFVPAYVIVDTISACQRMGSSLSAFNYVIRLVSYCNKSGITTILVNQTDSQTIEGLAGIMTFSMVDTIIRLSMRELASEINRLFMVIKSRGSAHSNQSLEFFITGGGIAVRPPYDGVGDPLTGSARASQEMKDKLEELELRLEKSELERQILIVKSERNLDMLKSQNRIDNLEAKIRDAETMEKIMQSNKEEMRQQRR